MATQCIKTKTKQCIADKVQFIPTIKGKLLMLRGYTYSMRNSNLYYCSKRSIGCRAQVKLRGDNEIVMADFNHTHEPPEYILAPSGDYVKL
ncbi:uncharacterized protein ACR2FA_011935 [Aphomia sociella]